MNQTTSIEERENSKQQEAEPLNFFLKKFNEVSSAEEKLRVSIDFMREALSQSGTPYFKGFWEVRKLCLPLFKEEISGPVRSLLWEEYIELTREGRRLKNLLDEDSAFAMEQIDIAIKALEEEVGAYHAHLEEVIEKTPLIAFAEAPQTLEKKMEVYQQLQRRLILLNAYASRINALRKELIKTEMRIRQKNKFFQRLSTLGDQVFPPRKDLIKEVSDAFLEDVGSFVAHYFSPEAFDHEHIRRNVFFFREEIKALQSLAKILTLNTHAFTKTREHLSECWDKLKGMEKELKKEYSQQKQKSAENCELVRAKLLEVNTALQEGKWTLVEGMKQFDDILRWMREVELTRHDVKILKDEIQAAKEPLQKQQEQAEEERRQKDKDMEQRRRNQLQELKEKVESLKDQVASASTDHLTAELDTAKNQLATFSMTKGERQMLDRSLRTIRDQIEEKRERTLLELSDDDRVVLDQLRDILNQRKQRRHEIKAQLEEYRKILGGSTLDFEKAIEYNELVTAGKERLEKIDEGIQEIEQKIRALRSR